ncbi:methyltransferase domain-containing protein [Microbaculum marinum]|uniref:Methyltransferase domain-containing protein n=1 Tax=Microbaculum marinum TaxID=1764581 RepID=A0AAW9REL1_9HYPH
MVSNPPPRPDRPGDVHRLFDRDLIRSRRARMASRLPEADFLLEEASNGLADRLAAVSRHFPLALDLGSHDGRLARAAAASGKVGALVSSESCLPLLDRLAGVRVAADEEALPFADESLDLVLSGLSLQWVNDLPGALVQIRRALRPDGLFLGALLGGDSLKELRGVLVEAESTVSGGISPRVAPFVEIRDAGALLQRAGFALPVVDSDTLTVRYGNPLRLLDDLRLMGWSNALIERSRSPLRRDVLFRAMDLYAQRHADPDGRVRATFEVIYLSGWAPDPSQQKPLRPGSARMRLADALGTSEHSTGESPSGSGAPRKD